MRKFKVGMAAVLILGIVALFFVVNAFAQSASERLNCPSGLLSILDAEEGINVECVNALFATLTPTTGAPTDTPLPPTDTPVPSGHDDETWHPVSADVSHTHNADPKLLNSVFGPVGALYGGQEISYPWQTWYDADEGAPPSPGNMENDLKHEGYKWENMDVSSGEFSPWLGSEACLTYHRIDNCITRFRIQYHWMGGVEGAVTRIHSAWLEAEVCERLDETQHITSALGECGILRTGLHVDYGPLVIPGHGNYVPLPNDPPEFSEQNPSFPPYKFHQPLNNANFSAGPNGEWGAGWSSGPRYGYNLIVQKIGIHTEDDWQGIDENDPFNEAPVCPQADCEFNHSTSFVRLLTIRIKDWDGNVDGFANYSGFTDRYGNIVSACSPLGVDCIPLEAVNVPVGPASFGNNDFIPAFQFMREFDLSPPGEWWIGSKN